MTRLAIRIDPVDDATLDALVVHVRQQGSRPQRVMVPIGGTSEVAVEPGRVLVEARLPSGRSVFRDQVVAGDADEIRLSLAPTRVGRVRSSTGGDTFRPVWHGTAEHLDELRPGRTLPDGVQHIERVDAGWRIRLRERGDEEHARRLLVVSGPTGGRVVLLPFPWQGAIDILVQPAETADEPPAVKLHLRDRELGPLVAYLHGGDLGSAREVASGIVAEQRLMGKMADPLGATVGGYALLALREYDRLHDWPRNLWRRFRWLPDGGIIWATQLLRSRGDVAEAAQALLEAAERGIPYFSTGVRLLVDGLRVVLASKTRRGDQKLGRALHDTERLCLLVDADAPPTSLVGSWSELDQALGWKVSSTIEAAP